MYLRKGNKMKMTTKMTIGAIAGLTMALMAGGCSRPETNSVLIVSNLFTHTINPVAVSGPTCTWICGTSVTAEIDISETQHLITTKPIDHKNTQWEKLVMNFSVKLNPSKVAQFYIDTKELDTYKTENGVSSTTTVGLNYFTNIVKPAIVKAAKTVSISQVLQDQESFQQLVLTTAQQALNDAQPGVFTLVRAQIVEANQPESLKIQAEQMGKMANEAILQQQEQTNFEIRKNKASQDVLVNALALKNASKESGLPASDIIEWEKARKFGNVQPVITAK
jgi:hypothetical protein